MFNSSQSVSQFSRSVMSDSLRPHESQHTRPPVHHKLPELTHTHVHRVGDAIQPSHPLLSLLLLPPIPPSMRVFSNQSTLCTRWTKCWSFSDLRAPQNKVSHCFHCFPIYLPWSDGTMILVFWMLSFKPTFSLSSFTFIKRLFSSSSLSAIRVVSSAYLRLLIFLLAILIPACASSSPAFLMMYSAYKLNKQGDNIQPWCTPFPIWNQSVVQCPVLTVASWPAYRFLKRQVRWSGITIYFTIFHSILWSTQSKALA